MYKTNGRSTVAGLIGYNRMMVQIHSVVLILCFCFAVILSARLDCGIDAFALSFGLNFRHWLSLLSAFLKW